MKEAEKAGGCPFSFSLLLEHRSREKLYLKEDRVRRIVHVRDKSAAWRILLMESNPPMPKSYHRRFNIIHLVHRQA